MMRWSPEQLQLIGYALGTVGVMLITVVAFSRPRAGPVLRGVAALLILAAGAMIWLGQRRGGTR